eukprot:UN22455
MTGYCRICAGLEAKYTIYSKNGTFSSKELNDIQQQFPLHTMLVGDASRFMYCWTRSKSEGRIVENQSSSSQYPMGTQQNLSNVNNSNVVNFVHNNDIVNLTSSNSSDSVSMISKSTGGIISKSMSGQSMKNVKNHEELSQNNVKRNLYVNPHHGENQNVNLRKEATETRVLSQGSLSSCPHVQTNAGSRKQERASSVPAPRVSTTPANATNTLNTTLSQENISIPVLRPAPFHMVPITLCNVSMQPTAVTSQGTLSYTPPCVVEAPCVVYNVPTVTTVYQNVNYSTSDCSSSNNEFSRNSSSSPQFLPYQDSTQKFPYKSKQREISRVKQSLEQYCEKSVYIIVMKKKN